MSSRDRRDLIHRLDKREDSISDIVRLSAADFTGGLKLGRVHHLGRHQDTYMDSIVEAVLGGSLTDAQVEEFGSKLTADHKKLFDEAKAFRSARQDEESKTTLTKAEREKAEKDLEAKKAELQATEERLGKVKQDQTDAEAKKAKDRDDKVSEAKARFFKEFDISAEKQADYESGFTKLDSGSEDPNAIYADFESVYAALNKDDLLKTKREQAAQERQAEEARIRAAGGGRGGQPPGNDPAKFSDATKELAKKAGITEEAADRVQKEGMHRVLG